MKIQLLLRIFVAVTILSGSTVKAGSLFWQIEELHNWVNPSGAGHQAIFYTHNGMRLTFLWATGPLVVPMDEFYPRQYDREVLYRPPTFDPFLSASIESKSTPAPTGTHVQSNEPEIEGGETPPENFATAEIPEPGTLLPSATGLGILLALRRRRRADQCDIA